MKHIITSTALRIALLSIGLVVMAQQLKPNSEKPTPPPAPPALTTSWTYDHWRNFNKGHDRWTVNPYSGPPGGTNNIELGFRSDGIVVWRTPPENLK